VLGPALRYAGETEALIWVETDGPCTVSVLGCEARTFCVEGHHYLEAWNEAVCEGAWGPVGGARRDDKERTVMRFMASAPARVLMRGLARLAGVEDPSVRWRYVHDEPWFDNQVAMLELDGRSARFVLEKTVRPEDAENPTLRLERVFDRGLA
jgi:hypothetical protein